MGKKIGIDLGTTYSCAYCVDETGGLKLLPNTDGDDLTPSVVFIDVDNNAFAVGGTARQEGAMTPENLVERVKNYMGDVNYNFTDSNGTSYSAAAISKLILQKIIAGVEEQLQGEEIDGAVITCPAYFGELARSDTQKAGEEVVLSNGQHLKVLKILDEPTAAAIAYGTELHQDINKTIMIYDLGGGTFDLTVMKINFNGDDKKMQVITTAGNHQLGGKDWDAALTDLVVQKFCAETGCDPDSMKADPDCRAWLSEQIEQAKKRLTAKDNTALTPQFEGQKAKITITRDEFEEATEGLLSETISLVDKMLADKGLTMAQDIDEIVLIGGSTFMPQVRNRLEKEYGKPLYSYEPNKAVAMGAALMANGMNVSNIEGDVSGDVVENGNSTQSGSLILPDGNGGNGIEIIETCTKSYGVRYYSNGAQVYGNFILKDTPKPAHGSSVGKLELCITGKPDLVYEVPILVFETDCMDELVPEDQVNLIYMEESIKLEEPVPGNVPIAIDMDVDANGILSLELKEISTGKTYKMLPRRITEGNPDTMKAVESMTLIV